MKINRRTAHKSGLGMLEGGAMLLYSSLSIIDPIGGIMNRQRITYCGPQQGKMYTASPVRKQLPLQLSQGETFTTLNSCFAPVNSWSKQPLSNPPSLKIQVLFFVCWSCQWFCHSLPVPNCDSLLFLNKPTFAGTIIVSFLRLAIHFKKNKEAEPSGPESTTHY